MDPLVDARLRIQIDEMLERIRDELRASTRERPRPSTTRESVASLAPRPPKKRSLPRRRGWIAKLVARVVSRRSE